MVDIKAYRPMQPNKLFSYNINEQFNKLPYSWRQFCLPVLFPFTWLLNR